MKSFSELTPGQTARRVGLAMLGVIVLVLAAFLLITLLTGDPSDHLEERQPSPSPAATTS